MKHQLTIIFFLCTIATTASALSFDQARHEALFLTDKMAYELALSTEQMEAVYEINLDYLLNVNRSSDLYGIFWERRNMDLRYVLSPYQYQAFLTANYFYRPLNWIRGAWRLAIYGRYADSHLFYYTRPMAWSSFRGGRNVGTRSYYMGRNYYAPANGNRPTGIHNPGMNPYKGQRPNGNMQQGQGQRPNGNMQPSSRQFGNSQQQGGSRPNQANPNQANPNQANPNQANPNQANPNQANPRRSGTSQGSSQQGQRVFRR